MSDNPVIIELKRIEQELIGKLETQDAEIKSIGGTKTQTSKAIETLELKLEGLGQEMKAKIAEFEAKAQRFGYGEVTANRTPGANFVDSQEFKDGLGRSGHKQIRMEFKALTGDVASVGNLVRPERLAPYIAPTEPHVRDLFAQGTTSANALEFPQFQAMTNNAAVVYDQPTKAQAINTSNYKPESDLVFQLKNFPVRTIAHLLRVHKNILDDAPALRSVIDEKMMWGLAAAEDVELIKGDGTGNHLSGILANSQSYTRGVAGDTQIDALRRAMTQLRLSHYRATGIVLNPVDWESIELLKDTQKRYIWVSVTDGGVPRLWRAPVVDSQAIDPNNFVMGDFKQGAQVFDRQQSAIEIFEQDRDNVALNLVTIRCEERISLVTYDQNAFVKGTFTPVA